LTPKYQRAHWKATKRTGDALPKRVAEVIETGNALVTEAKGLGRGRQPAPMLPCENFRRTSAPCLPQALQTKRPYFTSRTHQIAKTDVMAHEIRTAVTISLIHSQ